MTHAVEKEEGGWVPTSELNLSGQVFLVTWEKFEDILRGNGPKLIHDGEQAVKIRSTVEGLYVYIGDDE
jgi:hypothetical protein